MADGGFRVLLWYWGRRGGGAQLALGLARCLHARDDVLLDACLSSYAETASQMRALLPNAGYSQTYRSAAGLAATLWRLPPAVRDLRRRACAADAVLSVMPHIWQPIALPVLSLTGTAFVPIIHDAEPHPGDARLVWKWQHFGVFAHAASLITLSEHVALRLRKRAPLLDIHILGLPPFLTHIPSGAPARGERDGIRFLFFGRFLSYKGLDLLRDAFSELRRIRPEVHLTVVGHGNLDACAPGLRRLPGISVREGWVPEAEIPGLLSSCDAVVLPYREASQSGIIPQALALGKPVIVTPVGGLPEQVPPGCGVIAAGATARDFTEAMLRACDAATLKQWSEAARQWSVQTRWSDFADRVLAVLRNAAKSRRTGP